MQLCTIEIPNFINAVDFPNFMDPGPRLKYPEKSLKQVPQLEELHSKDRKLNLHICSFISN